LWQEVGKRVERKGKKGKTNGAFIKERGTGKKKKKKGVMVINQYSRSKRELWRKEGGREKGVWHTRKGAGKGEEKGKGFEKAMTKG